MVDALHSSGQDAPPRDYGRHRVQHQHLLKPALWVGTAVTLCIGQEPVGILFGVTAIAQWHLGRVAATIRDAEERTATRTAVQSTQTSLVLAELHRVTDRLTVIARTTSTSLSLKRRELDLWDASPGQRAAGFGSGAHRLGPN